MNRITRIEVIDENGRSYVNWEDDNDVSWQFQDDGRTLKVFVNKVKPEPKTLFDAIRNLGYSVDMCYEIVDAVEAFQKSQEPEEQKWDVVRESVKWCEEHPDKDPLDWVKPQTPEQVADGLREAFREAQKTEKWKEIQKKIDTPAEGIYDNIDIDKLLEKWDEDPPEFLRFVLGPTLEDRIYKWWETCFVQHPEWSMEECVEDLLDIIELFLPNFQSAAGSQSLGVEDMVEGFNDCLKKIKSKLRNKKDT